MTDLELDVWDAWLMERQEHLEETLSNISPSEEPCRYYLLTGYIQGMLEALTMLTTVEDGKRFKIKLEQFRQNLLLSGDYDATGNYKQAGRKLLFKYFEPPNRTALFMPENGSLHHVSFLCSAVLPDFLLFSFSDS